MAYRTHVTSRAQVQLAQLAPALAERAQFYLESLSRLGEEGASVYRLAGDGISTLVFTLGDHQAHYEVDRVHGRVTLQTLEPRACLRSESSGLAASAG